jgi:hypothetical protein
MKNAILKSQLAEFGVPLVTWTTVIEIIIHQDIDFMQKLGRV